MSRHGRDGDELVEVDPPRCDGDECIGWLGDDEDRPTPCPRHKEHLTKTRGGRWRARRRRPPKKGKP